jgi:hypothetical protein
VIGQCYIFFSTLVSYCVGKVMCSAFVISPGYGVLYVAPITPQVPTMKLKSPSTGTLLVAVPRTMVYLDLSSTNNPLLDHYAIDQRTSSNRGLYQGSQVPHQNRTKSEHFVVGLEHASHCS